MINTKSAPASAWARPAICLAAAALLVSCFGDGMLSGGGSGIENPALILAFKDAEGRPLPASGRLQFFDEASGWEDSSLYARTLNGQDTAMITSRDLAALPRGIAALDTLPPDSSVGFNISVSGTGREGLMTGFRLKGSRSRGYTFTRAGSGRGAMLRAEFTLAPPVLMFSGSIPGDQLDKGLRVVFVPGSPYFAPVALSGNLMFPLLPKGVFPVMAAAASPLSDTLFTFYCTTDSLDTGRPFAPGHWEPCAY